MSPDQDTENTDVEALADTVATAAEKAQHAEAQHAEAEPSGESTGKPGWRPSRAVLVAAGVGVVCALVGGGAGWAVGHHGAGGSSTAGDAAGLTLPSTLSSGYQRSSTVDTNIKTAVQSAQTTLGAGTDMALYTKDKTQLLVEATRLPGAALLEAGMTYAKVGDVTCATTSSTSGTEAICSRTDGKLTVEVTAATSDIAAKYADEVFNALA